MTDTHALPQRVPAGEWHQYRRDHHLSGRSPLAGRITQPAVAWTHHLGGSECECFPVAAAEARTDILFPFGGCVVRTDCSGSVLWKSPACGINAVGGVEDLDGDGRLEIVCCSGYEVIVLAAESGEILMRHYVGFPLSAGTQASSLLCHTFAPGGMHLIVPLMSSKEVLVFDFRNGCRTGVLAHTLWMDDAFHPTIAAADMNGDGVDELVVSKLSGLYVFDVLSGAMLTSCRWTSGGERHRNYGLLQLTDIDGDGAREVVIVAERVARHISVIDNDGHGRLSLRWDRFVEFIYPNDTTELRHTGNSVRDVDGDGRPELVVSIFNGRGDGRWWLEVIDLLTGAVKFERADTYLWGIQDVDGCGLSELLLGTELARNPAPFSSVEVVSVRDLRPVTLWNIDNARFAGRGLLPSGWKSNFRPIQFGHDETWIEPAPGGSTVFLFTAAGDGTRSIAELKWNGRETSFRSTSLETTGTVVMSALADVDGDGMAECILSENNGLIRIVRASKGIQAKWFVGFRQQLEGYSAARPGPVPVVYRSPGEPRPFIAIPDNTWKMRQLQVSGPGVIERWSRRGRGWMGYDNAYHSAYVSDLDGDGEPELLLACEGPTGASELLALDANGGTKYSWPFASVPAPALTRIGLYEWVVSGSVNAPCITASYYASYSMNSEQTITVDLQGRELWRRGQYGEGEWGRGMGPWSAYAVAGSRDGNPEILFLAKDLYCRLDARTGEWKREPWHLWRATNSVMNQPDWGFDKEHQADFGSEKDPFTAYGSPIILEEGAAVLVAGCFGGIGVLRGDDSIAWWKRAPFTDMMLRLPGIADIAGNGRLAVGCCHSNGIFECVDAEKGTTLWELNLGSTTSDIVSADIDGDGREEFVTGTTDGRLIAIGADSAGRGVIRWSLTMGFALGSPVIADVDGDGEAEILLVTGDGNLVCVGKE